jgi:hypothetical protein
MMDVDTVLWVKFQKHFEEGIHRILLIYQIWGYDEKEK